MNKITLKKISQDLSLNPATVSTILNGNKQGRKISPATVKRVQDYAEKIGYCPSVSALSMNGKYSKDIVIVSQRRMSGEVQQVYFRLINHLEKLDISHATVFYNEKGFPEIAKEIEFFNPQKIIVFSTLGYRPASLSTEGWNSIRKKYFSHIPCFFFDFNPDGKTLCNKSDGVAQMNRKDAYQQIVESMTCAKYTHIFLADNTISNRRFEISDTEVINLESSQACELAEPENAFHTAGLVEIGTLYGRQMLQKSFPKGKTAAFFGDDYVCCGAIEFLQDNGIKIPEDLEFFSLGHMAENRFLKYPFTSWGFPYDQMYKHMLHWIVGDGSFEGNKVFEIKKIIHS